MREEMMEGRDTIWPSHIRVEDQSIQTVRDHIVGVAQLAFENGKKIGMPHTASLSAKLHDMGKCTNAFRNYIRYGVSHPDDHSLRGKIDHSTIGAIYIYERFQGGDAFDRLTAQILALVVASHHGGLLNSIDMQGVSDFLKRMQKEKAVLHYDEAVQNFLTSCFSSEELGKEFLIAKNECIQIVEKLKKAKLAPDFSLHLVCKFLFSCLIDADRYDTMMFMISRTEPESPDFTSLLKIWIERQEEKFAGFETKSPIDPMRTRISEDCKEFASHPVGIYNLSVPTGGGKTLSSLRFGLNHALLHKQERIIYVVPYTSIIDQNAEETRNWLKCGEHLLEHHSNVIEDNKNEDYKLLTQRWDSPLIFTTMVQFLNTFYSSGTQNMRRLHNLANAVIIFDEIQAVPLKCIHLLNLANNFLNNLTNTTIVSCTATQPLLSRVERPLMLSPDPDIVPYSLEMQTAFKRVEIINRVNEDGWSAVQVADLARINLETLDSVLVIVNTKKAALSIFNHLKQWKTEDAFSVPVSLIHLSTNMCPKHRLQKIHEIKEKLGNQKLICISTQLIEAGVDLSFDCVIRSLAGMESICQAAGRCNRHQEVPLRQVYLVNILDEVLTGLPEIKIGQDCTLRVLREYENNPHNFDSDLLSPKLMERYYYYYYHLNKNRMDYPLDKDFSQYSLLSGNEAAKAAFQSALGTSFRLPLRQAFKDAAEAFNVIEQNTRPVLVPFGEGSHIIHQLNQELSLAEIRYWLQRSQQYSVNLYQQNLNQLLHANAVYELRNGGVFALSESFYDDEIGVDFASSKMDFLIDF